MRLPSCVDATATTARLARAIEALRAVRRATTPEWTPLRTVERQYADALRAVDAIVDAAMRELGEPAGDVSRDARGHR